MAKRFIDLYNEEQQKKQAGAQKASLPAAPVQKKAQTTQKASLTQLSMPGSIGQTYRNELPKLEMPKLKKVRTTTPQIKKSYAPKAGSLPNIRALGAGDYTGSAKLMEKAAQTIKSGLLGSASGFAEIVGQATPTTGDQHMGQFSGFGDLGRAVRERRETGADINESIQRMEQARSEKRKASQQRIYDTATKLAEESSALREQAKQGAGKVGGFFVDLGATGTQVAGDALANALLPGSGMAMMATRVYGQSAGDARREGKTEGQQFAAGLKGAAIETLTEKLFGGLAKAYGAGTADEVVEKIAEKLTRSDAGKRAATWLINSGGEGVEEVLSDILNPLADRALGLDDGEGRILTADDAAQMGYDFLLGAAMGALGGAGQLRAAKSTTATQETQPVQMPELVDANGRTTAQRQTWAQLSESQRVQLDEADKIARRFGARVELDGREGVNGSYRGGVITLNPNAANPMRQTLIHELTHHMESSGLYSRFSDTAMRYMAENMGADVENVRQAVMADYARSGVALDKEGATREIVAKFAEEKLFTDEATVRWLLLEDRNLFQRIYDWIRDALNKLTGTEEETYLRNAEKLYAKALRETGAQKSDQGAQMLFAGKNAKTADLRTMEKAAALEADGISSESILKETGWFRGMDGEWRFEIDDSGMEYRSDGDARLLEERGYRRLQELTDKWAQNAEGQGDPLTVEEQAEFENLADKYYDSVWAEEKYELADFLRHSGLFEAYPKLRHTSLAFEKTEPGVNGYYNAETDTIVLSDSLRWKPESTLVHEIQHVIQRAEGFARGSSPEYWARRDYENGDVTRFLEREYGQVLAGLDSETRNKYLRYQEVNRAMENLENAEDGTPAAEKFIQLEKVSDRLYTELWDTPEFSRLLDLKRQIDTPREVYDRFYRNTAGEIEARDAAARRNYSAEQRLLRMPQLGDANTVFADGNGGWGRSVEYNPEAASIKNQIENSRDVLNKMDVVARATVPENLPNKDTAAKWAVEQLRSSGYKVDRQGYGEILFSKKDIDKGLRYADTPAEKAALTVLPQVLKRGIEVGDHGNHKQRSKQTVTFAAPVELNGVRGNMGVVVNRNGNHYYAHRIVLPDGTTFKFADTNNDATQELSRGVAFSSSLADTTSVASDISIPNNGENVNTARNEVKMPVIGESTPAEVTRESVSEANRAEADAYDAYMDALAQDENILTDDPYTPADAVYDAQLRRLEESEAPPATEREQALQADLDELASLYADQADVIGRREYLQDATSDMVTSKTTPKKQSKREAAREAWDFFYRKMVDAGHSVTKLSEAVGDPYLYQFYNQARASSSAGVNMITDAQTDVRGRRVGDSLNGVFSPIRARGDDIYRDFQLYMFDLHNIDRMSLSEGKAEKVLEATAALRDFDAENPGIQTDTAAQLHRLTEDPDPDIAALARERERLLRNLDKAEAIQDKPVFDYEFSAEDSRARAEKLLAQHPEFAEYQAQVRKYIDNMMQYRVDSGLMTQENADFLKAFYPNYVPTMRVQDKDTAGRGRDLNAVRIGKTVGRAQGGTERLVPLHEALGKQTMKVAREGSKNRFADRLLRDYLRAGDTDAVNRYVKEAIQYEHEFSAETLDDAAIERPSKDKIVTAYMDGKLWEMTVDDTLFDAVKALSPDTAESNKLTRVARGANNLFKSLVTGYNPTFLARNVIRDLQTAGLNTRDAAAFARNYPRALAEIKNNGDYWQLYKALGGVYSSVFDYNTGTVKEPKGRMGKVMARVEALNMAAEQAPRLAEFMGVMQKAEAAKQRGEAVSDLAAEADALYAAADITVNFGRSGSLGKVLNANYVPFLNPGVQGLDKLVRRVTETKGAKEWAKLAARAVALGITPSLLNALLYHDDDEWDDLRDSDKDTNYMFKLGNGYWLKIPKGRELSLLGITADRVADAVKGEDVDILSTINTMGNQVAPANPLTSNIFSALIDSQLLDPDSPGRTWYGGDIESQRLQNYAPGERYDSSTDVFSKAVGKALGISPKKLNYVLDQYSGVLGDFLLPVLTPQAERGMFEKAFTVDAKSSNRVSGDFYDRANELKYAKNAGDVASGVVSRWWNKQQTACSDLWKQIREVEASAELSDSEKKQQTRELKAIVTGIQKSALAQEDVFREAAESHLEAGEDEDTAYREANKDCFGAEYALQAYNKDVYERAQDAKRNGVSYDDFYTYYFGTKDIKATGTESAASQKFDYLRRSGISEDAQAEIYFADMASDKTLLTQAELEISAGITPAQYYSYKAATSSMSKKAEKLEAIAAMDLTAEQKDALYYSEGWAESKIYEAPWRSGGYVGVSMPVLGSSNVAMPILGSRKNASVQMPVLGGDTVKMPVLEERATQHIKMPVLG